MPYTSPVIESSRAATPGPRTSRVHVLAVVLAIAAFAACSSQDRLAEIRGQQAAGQFAVTIEPLRELLAERPDDPEVNFRYGLALGWIGQPGLAEWSLRKAMKDPDWRIQAALALGQGALAGQNFDTALEAANVVLEADPDHVAALMMRANTLAHSKMDYAQALADAERILELDPDFVDAYEPKVLALLGLERYDEAGEAIEEMGSRIDELGLGEQQHAWQCATLAIYADDSQREALANERWEGCLEKFPGEPGVVWPAIKFFDARGQYARSREVLEVAVETPEAERDYRPALAGRLRFEGRNEEAEQLLLDGTDVADANLRVAAWMDLLKHYQELGDYAKAAEAARHGVEISREIGRPAPDLLLEYADSLVLSGAYDEALAVSEEMEVEPYRDMIRARVAQQKGDPAEALRYYDSAFLLWPNNPWARYAAAGAAEDVGDFDRALEEYRFAIRIDPLATDARVQVARLLVAEGKPNEALQVVQLKADQGALDLDGELVLLDALGANGRAAMANATVASIAARQPAATAKAAAAAARGMSRAGGHAQALRLLKSAPGLDLADPANVVALRALVEISARANQLPAAMEEVERAREASPQSGEIRAVQAQGMALAGAPASEVVQAFEEAVAWSPEDAHAWLGLGQALATVDPNRAVAALERAVTLDSEVAEEAELASAELLLARGDRASAEARMAAVLDVDPYSGAAAYALAASRLDRGQADARTTELAERALRFRPEGRVEEARALVARARAAEAEAGGN
jgi:tetratricopeptide (TPR) repeat protein